MENGNPVVPPDPKALETVREAIDPVAEFLIGPTLFAADDGLFLRKKFKRLPQCIRQYHFPRAEPPREHIWLSGHQGIRFRIFCLLFS